MRGLLLLLLVPGPLLEDTRPGSSEGGPRGAPQGGGPGSDLGAEGADARPYPRRKRRRPEPRAAARRLGPGDTGAAGASAAAAGRRPHGPPRARAARHGFPSLCAHCPEGRQRRHGGWTGASLLNVQTGWVPGSQTLPSLRLPVASAGLSSQPKGEGREVRERQRETHRHPTPPPQDRGPLSRALDSMPRAAPHSHVAFNSSPRLTGLSFSFCKATALEMVAELPSSSRELRLPTLTGERQIVEWGPGARGNRGVGRQGLRGAGGKEESRWRGPLRHLCQLHSLILASKSGAGGVPTSGKAPTGIPSLSCLVCSLVCWGMREGTGRNTQVGLENPAGRATAVTVPYTGGSSLAWPRPCSTGPAGPWAAGSRGAAATELRAHEQKVK